MSREHSKDLDMVSGCSHESKMHLYSAGQQCQWCHYDMDEIELNKRREAMRWRRWPEELPKTEGYYIVLWRDDYGGLVPEVFNYFGSGKWNARFESFADFVVYWRPIGPLPRGD